MTSGDRRFAPERNRRKPLWRMITLFAILVIAVSWVVVKVMDMNTPPKTVYTQAEAYAPMEAAAADAVSILPDFPGFEKRGWDELPCSHEGIDDPNYTNIEITYWFSSENSKLERVRNEYVELLRAHWISLGYEVTHEEDQERPGGLTDRGVAVERSDGISLWYSASGFTVLIVQSGCVPVSDLDEVEYIPPAGGIEPGGDGDLVEEYFPDGIPTDRASDEAIAPFTGGRAASPAASTGTSPWTTDPTDAEPKRYEGLL